MIRKIRNFLLTIVTGLLFFPVISFGGGTEHGARVAGMGTAFLAIADDLSAIAYNPAGLAGLKGRNIYLGGVALDLSSSYTSPAGGSEETGFRIFYRPHFYMSTDLGRKDMTLGIGLFSPFGIGGREWPVDGLTRYRATKSETGTLALNPTFAYQLSPNLSVGAGVDYMWVYSKEERMIDQSLLGAGDGLFKLEGDGGGWRYNLGVLLSVDNGFSFGFAYRSGVKVEIDGTARLSNIAPAVQPLFGGARFETAAYTSQDFPEIWSLGSAYRPTEKLVFGLDLEWFLWSTFDRSDVDFANEVPLAGFTDTSAPKDWKDILTVKVGFEYMANPKLALRGGYAHVPTSVPDHTLEPGNAHSDQHNFSVGFGYRIERLVIDLFYTVGFFEDRRINNAILSGTYENFVQYAGLSMGYGF